MRKNSILLIWVLIFCIDLHAQQSDTLYVKQIYELKNEIESLKKALKMTNNELERVKQVTPQENEFDKLLAALEVDEESIPEDQRSRRRRLDRLLKAITERPGQLRFNGSASGIIQGNTSKGNRFSTGLGLFDIYAHTAFGPNSVLFIDLNANGGKSPDDYISSITSLNANSIIPVHDEGIDHIRVREAWAEFNAFRDFFHVTSGIVDLSNYFDINALANDETSQFLSACFVNSSAIPFPNNAPGVRIRTEVPNYFFLQFGVQRIDTSEKNLFNRLFKIASIGLRVFANTDFEGNVRIYGYSHPSVRKSAGYGISFDKSLIRSLSIFARWNKNEHKLAEFTGIRTAWSCGSRFLRLILNRYFIVGIAYGVTTPQTHELREEKIGELYARMQLNNWTYFSPHLQFIRNTGGISGRDTILGFRTQFEF